MQVAWLVALWLFTGAASAPAQPEQDTAAPLSTPSTAASPESPEAKEGSAPEAPEVSGPVFETTVRARRAAPTVRSASEQEVESAVLHTLPPRSGEEALRLVPGLLMVQHGGEGKAPQLFLRGFDALHGADVEITLDGVPLNEPSNVHGHGYVDLGLLPALVVRDIHVTKGPFDPAQGDFATAGTLRLRTGIAPEQRGIGSRYTYGTTGRHQLTAWWAPKDSSDFVAAEAVTDAGLLRPGNGANRFSERVSGYGRWTLLDPVTGDWGRLRIIMAGSGARFGLPGALPRADVVSGQARFFDSYPQDTQGASVRGLGALQHRIAVAGGALESMLYGGWRHLQLRENYTGYLLHPSAGDEREQLQETTTLGARVRFRRPLLESGWVDAGATWRTDVAYQRQVLADETIERELPFSVTALALHAELRWSLVDQLTLRAGLRGDLFLYGLDPSRDAPEGTFAVRGMLSPRASVQWSPREEVTVVAAYGRGLRSPEARAVGPAEPLRGSLVVEEAPIQGEITTTDTAEVGARLRLNETLEATLAGFATYLERESIYDHVTGTNLERNATLRAGGDASVAWRPWEGLLLSGSVTAVDARFVDSGAPVPGVPVVMASAVLLVERALPQGSFDAGLRGQLLGPRPIGADLWAPPVGLVQAAASYRWRFLRVGVVVDNLLDARWRESELFFASRWDVEAPVSALPQLQWVAGMPRTLRTFLEMTL